MSYKSWCTLVLFSNLLYLISTRFEFSLQIWIDAQRTTPSDEFRILRRTSENEVLAYQSTDVVKSRMPKSRRRHGRVRIPTPTEFVPFHTHMADSSTGAVPINWSTHMNIPVSGTEKTKIAKTEVAETEPLKVASGPKEETQPPTTEWPPLGPPSGQNHIANVAVAAKGPKSRPGSQDGLSQSEPGQLLPSNPSGTDSGQFADPTSAGQTRSNATSESPLTAYTEINHGQYGRRYQDKLPTKHPASLRRVKNPCHFYFERISGLKSLPQWVDLPPQILETNLLNLILVAHESRLSTPPQTIAPTGENSQPSAMVNGPSESPEDESKIDSAADPLTGPANSEATGMSTNPLLALGPSLGALQQSLYQISADLNLKSAHLSDLADLQKPLIEKTQVALYQMTSRMDHLASQNSHLQTLRRSDGQRLQKFKNDRDLALHRLSQYETGITTAEAARTVAPNSQLHETKIKELEKDLKETLQTLEEERQVHAAKKGQTDDTINQMIEIERELRNRLCTTESQFKQQQRQESELQTQKMEKAMEDYRRLERDSLQLRRTGEEQFIATQVAGREIAKLREQLAMANSTAANKMAEADKMNIQVDQLKAQLAFANTVSTASARASASELAQLATPESSAPTPLPEQPAPTEPTEPDEDKYASACGTSSPRSGATVYHSPAIAYPIHVYPSQAKAASTPEPIPIHPNPTKFDQSLMPRDTETIHMCLQHVRPKYCLAESPRIPYLRVILDKTTKFMDHPLDAEDFTSVCCEEDECKVRDLRFKEIKDGYAYYQAKNLYEISHLRADDSEGEVLAWSQLTRFNRDGSRDFYFEILPTSNEELKATVRAQWPNPRPETETLYCSVFSRIAFKGPAQRPFDYWIQAYSHSETFYVNEHVSFPLGVTNGTSMPGYWMNADWLKRGGGSDPVLVSTALLANLKPHWIHGYSHDTQAETKLGGVILAMSLTPNLPTKRFMARKLRAYSISRVIQAPVLPPVPQANY